MEPLLEKARGGDRAALEALLAEVAPRVHRFARRMCTNVHDAEDVLQDTLLNIAGHLGEFEGRSSLSSWVFALTRSACARKRRGLKNQPGVEMDLDARPGDGAADPETQAAQVELRRALDQALSSLSEEHREVIALRDVEGLSAQETADALGLSVDAVKSRLHRARAALRAAMAPVLEASPKPADPSCPDVVRMWSGKLENELDALDCAQMEKHVASCGSCGAACDALRSALSLCQAEAAAPVSPEIQARVKAAIQNLVTTGHR